MTASFAELLQGASVMAGTSGASTPTMPPIHTQRLHSAEVEALKQEPGERSPRLQAMTDLAERSLQGVPTASMRPLYSPSRSPQVLQGGRVVQPDRPPPRSGAVRFLSSLSPERSPGLSARATSHLASQAQQTTEVVLASLPAPAQQQQQCRRSPARGSELQSRAEPARQTSYAASSPHPRQTRGSITLPTQQQLRRTGSEVQHQPPPSRMAVSTPSGITTPNSSGGSTMTPQEGTPSRSVKSLGEPSSHGSAAARSAFLAATKSMASMSTRSGSSSCGGRKLSMGAVRAANTDPVMRARLLVSSMLDGSLKNQQCVSQHLACPAVQHVDSESERTLDVKELGERQVWQGAPEGTFPKTGKPITVKLICSCTEIPDAFMVASFMGHPITSDWGHDHLLQVSEMFSGVHRDAQKLYHAGREITPGNTIRTAMGVNEDQLPSRCAIHVLVDRESFPQRLGPFSVVEVPLGADSFILPTSVEGGFHWTMKSGVLERHGIRTYDARVTAQCSPTHPITLSDEERAMANIPTDAVEFAWSYPVVNWEQVDQDPHVLDDWASMKQEDCALKDFLVVGGFVYLDQEHNIVRVTTPRDNKAETGGLQFGKPQKWQPMWTKALLGDGRFQRVTIGPLRDAGVRFFCWLRPGERFMDEDMRPLSQQPRVPHGGFAYLFHEMASPSSLECAVDCYFPVLAMYRQKPKSKGEPFVLVGQEAITSSDLVGHTSAQLHVHSMSLEDFDA